ncbi:MAG: glycerate kinase [Thermotogae bacterium]|nr:MAG: glycerate kinase [Thermotogota bacterium]
MSDVKDDALKIVNYAIRKSLPDEAVRAYLERNPLPAGRVILIAIGKAAWNMAKAAKDVLGKRVAFGIVITKYEHSRGSIDGIEIYEAGHPVPDQRTLTATERVLQITKDLRSHDTVLFLVSGGGSSLFEKPKGLTVNQLQEITEKLLKCGANIVEINTVRKHLSLVKGGRFAQHVYPARVVSLLLSDVLGDRPDSIASGPAYPDSTTCSEAFNILKRYGIEIDENIKSALSEETPKRLRNVETHVVGSVRIACEKAAEVAGKLGYNAIVLTTSLNCEAKEAGKFLASLVREEVFYNRPIRKPCAIIMGGETTVHVIGTGKGGRNQELALSASIGIRGLANVVVASVGTDGTDGPTDAAGGIVDGRTYDILKDMNIDVEETLKNNDSYSALWLCDGLVITGPTGTNVNDLILALIK